MVSVRPFRAELNVSAGEYAIQISAKAPCLARMA